MEALPLLLGLKLVYNVGWEVHLFGDNAAALMQFLRCRASTCKVFQQRLLRALLYLVACMH